MNKQCSCKAEHKGEQTKPTASKGSEFTLDGRGAI